VTIAEALELTALVARKQPNRYGHFACPLALPLPGSAREGDARTCRAARLEPAISRHARGSRLGACDPEESRTPALTLGVSSLEVPRTYSVFAAHGAGATPHPLPGGALLPSRSGTGASSGSTWLIFLSAAAALSSYLGAERRLKGRGARLWSLGSLEKRLRDTSVRACVSLSHLSGQGAQGAAICRQSGQRPSAPPFLSLGQMPWPLYLMPLRPSPQGDEAVFLQRSCNLD
jgi:hypothetical protein